MFIRIGHFRISKLKNNILINVRKDLTFLLVVENPSINRKLNIYSQNYIKIKKCYNKYITLHKQK